MIAESTFVRLLGDVRPGTPHERTRSSDPAIASPATPVATVPAQPGQEPTLAAALPGPAESAPSTPPHPARPAPQGRPLSGRRVLVLGGTHPEAVAARGRIVELGGAAAINLSSSVTDIVLLDGGERDRRMKRITALAFPTHDAAWLDTPVITPLPRQGGGPAAPCVLPRGGVIDLPQPNVSTPAVPWTVTASWAQQTSCEIDVVAFVVDEEEQVCFDEDFVFHDAPGNPGGTVRLHSDGPTEQTIGVDLAALPPSARKVVVAAAIDGSPAFGTWARSTSAPARAPAPHPWSRPLWTPRPPSAPCCSPSSTAAARCGACAPWGRDTTKGWAPSPGAMAWMSPAETL